MIMLATWERPGQVAIEAAGGARTTGKDLMTCLELGLAAAEEEPELIAIGRGAVPNSEGEIELDAAAMRGSDLSSGAVGALRGVLPAISVARAVMEHTDHMLLVGEAARAFALEQGFEERDLMTDHARERYERWREEGGLESRYVHTADEHDTVTMIGLQEGKFVSASSTSGLSFKLPGRVGDSPIVGAGVYADDEAGCAGATGWGEHIWGACLSFKVVELMRSGATAQEACDRAIREAVRRRPEMSGKQSVALAIDRDGGYGAATTRNHFDLWIDTDGEVTSRRYEPKGS